MFKDADAVNISRSPLLRGEVPHTTTPALTQRYLDHLALTPAQRYWVEEEITQVPSGAGNGKAFIALQAALGSLAEGDELHARLTLSLPATRHAEYPAAWLRRQQVPVIRRSSMASKPFLRSPQDALRHFFSQQSVASKIGDSLKATFVLPARRTSARGKRLVRAAVVWGIILMGGLTAPAFAHAHGGDRLQINPSSATQQLTNGD
ncbi:MAG: hypothetical protein ACYCY2_13745 [Acidithiobacillus ferriphilus]|uniref:Uncharacterized protein n=1 Tax=Acidithiobacillus ferrivorans SS3 TaxID=743299 RepID=G0JQ99_9PROT|nr:hypothetical protein [Acidithiobacillus ferrivorans]AEM46338.1 hypothetical protein Acife_0098 [Acidithiobacillus ferrivorans SS3]MBN6742037.1 hypothetical protein [Acidithiobacillus sp. MC6.1]MBU2766807.1 hypothetical protein [Acidithiobacillus ferrivorans]